MMARCRCKCCVLCKRELSPDDPSGTESVTAYVQRCPSCGYFVAEAPAVRILDGAVKEGIRTREEIVGHFSRFISSEKSAGRSRARITDAAAQSYCYGH